MKIEIETCLVVLGARRAEFCAGLEFAASSEQRELCDTYFDTTDGRLHSAHMILRRRVQTIGGTRSELLTWKGKGRRRGAGGIERAELEGVASAGFLGELFAAVRAAGVALDELGACDSDSSHDWLSAAGLSPVHSRETTRRALLLRDESGAPLCELAIDRVNYALEDSCVVHHELELEALDGASFAQVEALAGRLVAEHGAHLRPWLWSKTALGRELQKLQQRGELAALLEGDQLSAEGYEHIEALLDRD